MVGGAEENRQQPGFVDLAADPGQKFPYSVTIRRSDGSIRELARFLGLGEAQSARDRAADAVAAGEEWIRKLIEVSSGELRP